MSMRPARRAASFRRAGPGPLRLRELQAPAERDCGIPRAATGASRGGPRRRSAPPPIDPSPAWRKGPVERSAEIVDFLGVVGQPFACRPRHRFVLGALEKIAVVLGVTASDLFALAALVELLDRVGTGRSSNRNRGLVPLTSATTNDFATRSAKRSIALNVFVGRVHRHGCSSLHRKAASKNAESPEEQLLFLAQQTVAPIDDGPHRAVPRHCRTAARPQQRQDSRPGGRRGLRCQAPRRQERRTRSPAASRRARGKSRPPAVCSHRSARNLRRLRLRARRTVARQGRPPPRRPSVWTSACGLPSGPRRYSLSPATRERLPAGRQNVDVPRSAEKRRRQARHLVDDMLAIVEQEEHPVVSEGSDQSRESDLRCGFVDRARSQPRSAPGERRREMPGRPARRLVRIRRPFARRRRGRPSSCRYLQARRSSPGAGATVAR